MQDRHSDRKRYFLEQAKTTEKYVIPYVQEFIQFNEQTAVLEIGCGEGGNLLPFLDLGCTCVGVDIVPHRIENAKKYFEGHQNHDKLSLIAQDIYKADHLEAQFDFIFLRDVIEHIYDQDKFMGYVKRFLKPEGKVFFGFPPWQNPFGGHQQVCESKLLSKLPYFHILPRFMYKGILKAFGENEGKIESLLEVKDTQITIERFKRILKKHGYHTYKQTYWFINPNYETKFGLKPRVQTKLITWIPFFRNFTITAMYALVGIEKNANG